MAFWGNEFIFDDIPCSEFGLMIYSFDSNSQDDVSFQGGEIIEDRLASRYDALTYGLVQNQALEYTLVFGVNPESLDAVEGLDRYEIEAVAAWLTGHKQRKWLVIYQPDTESFRYKCFISELRLITYGDIPWAFSCKVSCDSPFAYTLPLEFTYNVDGETTVPLFNRSSYNGFYKPVIEITDLQGDTLSIVNQTDGNRAFKLSGLPASKSLKITVDNKNQVITNNQDLNLYPFCNMSFFRLVRGDNVLKLSGNATIKFVCEFPVNIGG